MIKKPPTMTYREFNAFLLKLKRMYKKGEQSEIKRFLGIGDTLVEAPVKSNKDILQHLTGPGRYNTRLRSRSHKQAIKDSNITLPQLKDIEPELFKLRLHRRIHGRTGAVGRDVNTEIARQVSPELINQGLSNNEILDILQREFLLPYEKMETFNQLGLIQDKSVLQRVIRRKIADKLAQAAKNKKLN